MRHRTQVALAFALALVAILALSGCSTVNRIIHGVRPADSKFCGTNAMAKACAQAHKNGAVGQGPGRAVEDEAWAQAVEEAGAKLMDGGKWPIKTIRPQIHYLACDWIVPNAIVAPGQSEKHVCASGKTTADGKAIWVSVMEPGRVKALLVWEFRNSIYIRNGYGGWAY